MAHDDWPEELQGIWESLENENWSDTDREQWENEAQALFEAGWIDTEGYDTEELEAIRDEFFALMEEFDIDIEDFDWDAWRDWYASA